MNAFREDLHRDFELDIVTTDPDIKSKPTVPGANVYFGVGANSQVIRDLYRNADLFVLPTRADCLPIAILEAMAAGLPVVASRVGAVSEAVKHRESGLLLDEVNPCGIIAAVREAANSTEQLRRWSTAARNLAVENYDSARNYGTILANMTKRSRGT